MWRAARALIACGYPTRGGASAPDELSHNLNTINGLKLYHSIRGESASFCTSRLSWNRLASPTSTPMGGGPRSGISPQSNTPSANSTRKGSRASTSTCGRGSSAWCAALFAFRRQNICMIWSSDYSSTSMSSDGSFNMPSTTLKHPNQLSSNAGTRRSIGCSLPGG